MRGWTIAILTAAGTLAFLAPRLHAQTDRYPLTPLSSRQPGVPEGKVTQATWTSTIFPGTVRDYWVYVPAQYKAETPAAVMVFQDGGRFVTVDEKSRWRVPIVFDNLIHRGEMPVTIGIFVDPGVLPAPQPEAQPRFDRSFEYDGLGDRYVRFLLEEILPEVAKTYNLTTDPNLRAIGGSSSGGIASFTAAWNRPDAFRRVLSFIGSYTNLRGGNIYPSLVRKTAPKPLRVFLQDGSHDNNLYSGDWWIGNQDLASALLYAGYDVSFVKGEEGHNNIHGSAVLPDALRWLFRDWKQPLVASPGLATSERHFVAEILAPGKGWELLSEGHGFTEGPAVDGKGDVFFSDIPKNRIHKIEHATGKVTVFKENTGGANGLMFGKDGRLYACQKAARRVVSWAPDGTETVLATDVDPNDLAVGAKGDVYFTEPAAKKVWLVDAKGQKRVVHEGLEYANGVRLSPDQSLLVVADSKGRWVWSFQVGADGSLLHGLPFYRLETPDESSVSSADGMTFDTEGYLYVATALGIQVLDQPGRLTAVIERPQPKNPTNVVFGGPELDTLYVTARDKVYRRLLRRKGVFPWQPQKPPQPRL
jgi:sugar lactone lactonase YvrE/enterochelin esterase-like enzyme